MAKDFTPSSRNREAFEAMTDTVGNVPPQAVELEEAVLGALMLEKDCIITVQEFVSPEAFYTEEHRLIYKAINELSMELKPIDLYTVTERLKAKKELKKVGGASYLAQLTQKVGSAANVEFHAKIIAQKYVQRELIRSATEIQKRSYDESTDVTELIGYAEGEIFKVAEGHVKRSVQSSKDILARALMQIEEASKNTSAFSGVPSGFMALDRVTLGWQLSDLIIVAARPSMGKTAFVLSMARNMAVDHEQGVAFFSLEMSSVQLMMRLIIAETGLSGNDVKSGRLTPEQWRHLESATKPLGTAPLFIDDTPALSVFEFRSKARRLKIHNDIKIIIIDYLQLMTGNQDTKGNREQEVAFISRTLKAIAKELNVPMIALSQLSRATEMRGGSKRPQLSDLRESGAIEQDADIVAFIHRPEYYGINQDENGMPTAGMAEIILAKHRNGAVCDVNLRFLKEQARFADVEDSMLPPAQAAESQQAYDDYAIASYESATASVAMSEADLTQAETALSYTTVSSPLSGYISERSVDIGTLVGPNGKSLLATVVKSDTVRVDFSMTGLDYLKSKARNVNLGQKDSTRKWDPYITITLADNTQYPLRGLVDFADPQVDPETGTFSVRAEMANPDRILLPGQFTKVRLLLDVREDATVVPTKSVVIEKGGAYIFVIRPDSIAERRLIELGPEVNNRVIVERGVVPGEKIVVEGFHKLTHGDKVDPVPVPEKSSATETEASEK